MRKKKKSPQPTPSQTGSEVFGQDPEGKPTGSEAFGEGEPEAPLKGALVFGNDPKGNPTGADAFGESEAETPLKGALLFGNDPKGNPTGADSFGESEASFPLKGALLFGNDPRGLPTGADAFGIGDEEVPMRGADSFGAPQLVPERLSKDDLGYDFAGVLLEADDVGIAGIRKSAGDRLRARVLSVLERRLFCDPERLRSGLRERSIPWGRLRRDKTLDLALAKELRSYYSKAPGEVLGIAHVRDILEGAERMHTFSLSCDWEGGAVDLAVTWYGDVVAFGKTRLHKEHKYFEFSSVDEGVLAYVDALAPRKREQRARIRGPDRTILAMVELREPGVAEEIDEETGGRFKAVILDRDEKPVFELHEERAVPRYFRALLRLPGEEDPIGKIEDRLTGGKVATHIELDLFVPRVVAWGLAAVMADLARLRRGGWPESYEDSDDEIEPIEVALGKPRSQR